MQICFADNTLYFPIRSETVRVLDIQNKLKPYMQCQRVPFSDFLGLLEQRNRQAVLDPESALNIEEPLNNTEEP